MKKRNIAKNNDLESYVDRIVSALFCPIKKERNNQVEDEIKIIKKNSSFEKIEKIVGNRKQAELKDEQRNAILKKAIDKVTYVDLQEEKNLEHYFAELSVKSRIASIEYEEKRKISLEEEFRNRYKFQIQPNTANRNNTKKQKKEKDLRAAGTSMRDILNSENFKNMWESRVETDDSLEII